MCSIECKQMRVDCDQLRLQLRETQACNEQAHIELLVYAIKYKEYDKVLAKLFLLNNTVNAALTQLKGVLYSNVLNDFRLSLEKETESDINVLCQIGDLYNKREDFLRYFLAHVFLSYPTDPFHSRHRLSWCRRQAEKYDCYFPKDWQIKHHILSHFMTMFRSELGKITFPIDVLVKIAADVTLFEKWSGQELRAELLSNHATHYVQTYPAFLKCDPVDFFNHIKIILNNVLKVVDNPELVRVAFETYLHDYAKKVFSIPDLECILTYVGQLAERLQLGFNTGPFETQLQGYVSATVEKWLSRVKKLFLTLPKVKYTKKVYEESKYMTELAQLIQEAFTTLNMSDKLRLDILNAVLKNTLKLWRASLLELRDPVNPEQVFHDFLYLQNQVLAKYNKDFLEEEILHCKTFLSLLVASIYPNGDFVDTFKARSTDFKMFLQILRLKGISKKEQESLTTIFHDRREPFLMVKK